MLSAFGLGVIASVFFTFATQLPTWSKNKHTHPERPMHMHTSTQACTNIQHTHTQIGMHKHTHAHVHSWHAHHTHTHTCKTYIDALVIVVCCFVLVNIELAMGMM